MYTAYKGYRASQTPSVHSTKSHVTRLKWFAGIYLFILFMSLLVFNYYIVKEDTIKYQVIAVDNTGDPNVEEIAKVDPAGDWWDDLKDEIDDILDDLDEDDDVNDDLDDEAENDDRDDCDERGRHHRHHHGRRRHHKGGSSNSSDDDEHSELAVASILVSIVAFIAIATICLCYISCASNLFNATVR